MKSRYPHYRGKGRFVGLAIVLVALVALVVMMLWNWLMPSIFSLPELTYLQALGLLLLSKILFSGFGHKRSYSEHSPWRKRFMKRWHECYESRDEMNISSEATKSSSEKSS